MRIHPTGISGGKQPHGRRAAVLAEKAPGRAGQTLVHMPIQCPINPYPLQARGKGKLTFTGGIIISPGDL